MDKIDKIICRNCDKTLGYTAVLDHREGVRDFDSDGKEGFAPSKRFECSECGQIRWFYGRKQV